MSPKKRPPLEGRLNTLLPFDAETSALRSLAANEIMSVYARCLEQEMIFRKNSGMDVFPLRFYLRNLFSPDGKVIRVGWEGYGQRLTPVIEELRRSSKDTCILDAGCGYGTESLLFSLFPAKVWGVDLVPERVALARSRMGFFQSLADRSLDLTFVNAHIFRFLETSPKFDIIWSMEAISHIYPPEKFFRICRKKLKDGGKLIISDPNGLNPLSRFRSLKIRRSILHKHHQRFLDPETRQPVDVGQEKIFSTFRIIRFLETVGFTIQAIDISGFMGSSFLPQALLDKEAVIHWLGRYQRAVQKIPLLRLLGSIYTLVATKGAPDSGQD